MVSKVLLQTKNGRLFVELVPLWSLQPQDDSPGKDPESLLPPSPSKLKDPVL